MRRLDNNSISFDDYDLVRKILINTKVDDKIFTVATLDNLISDGGTWSAFGDATNLTADHDSYVKQNGSIKFDIDSSGGTTAGIVNTSLNSFDLTDYLNGNGALFVWTYINSATNITNFTLRLGNDASNYYSKAVTSSSEGSVFRSGWQLLRFDLASLTTVGSVTDTAITYANLHMTKDSAKVSETGYRFDSMILRRGDEHYLYYYSKFGWQSTTGTYKENSTLDTDYLNADTDEFNLFVEKGVEIIGYDVDENDRATRAFNRFERMRKNYQGNYPSQRKQIIQTYADFIK